MSFFEEMYNQIKTVNGEIKVFVMTESLPIMPWAYNDLKKSYTTLMKGIKFFIKGNDFLINATVITDLLKYQADIIIVAGSWTYPTFLMVAFSRRIKASSLRFVWTESHNKTGINNYSKTSTLVQWVKRKALEQFDGFCVPGSYALETLNDIISLEDKRIILLPNLVDSDYYCKANDIRNQKETLRESHNIGKDQYVFISPARFVDLKGIVPFLENVKHIRSINKITFVFIGGGPQKDIIKDTAEKNRLDVRLYDYQTQEQVREWLALADAFLLPSLSDANPLSSIEAAWAGLPLCLSCYVGNGPELVEEGRNGIIFDTLNEKSVCNKISFITNQSKEWHKNAGILSNSKARCNFELKKQTEEFIRDLENIMVKNKI